jgi:DNA-binding response OmpR family regulator
MKIALVEQDELLSDLVSFRLELLGHEVAIWNTAHEMLAKLGETNLDVLIIDTHQADMQGWEAIQKVRHSYSEEQLPILAVSIDTELGLVEQAYKAGANDYLIIPFDPAILQSKIEALLMLRHHLVGSK